MKKIKANTINNVVMATNFLTESMFKSALPARHVDAHKGMFGSVAVIGGDTSMVGAIFLASRAALYSGAGRVYSGILCQNPPVVDYLQPEIMLRPVNEIARLAQLDSVVIGPGLGQSEVALSLLTFWLAQNVPLLLDADALNLISMHPNLVNLIKQRQVDTVITPHAGEAARLLDVSNEQIQHNRMQCALKLATSLHVTCVLKGSGTICAHHDRTCFVNTSGNVGLASGGTGDVLSGIIGSLMAQGLSGLEAAKLGVYVHGTASDILVKNGIGPVGLTASEVTLEVRNVLNALNNLSH